MTTTSYTGELAPLRNVGQVDGVLDHLVRLVARALRVPRAKIIMAEDGSPYASSIIMDQPGTPDALGVELCRSVISSGRRALIRDVGGEEGDLSMVAFAAVPMAAEDGSTLGSLGVADAEPRSWSGADTELLELFAAQAASEIEPRRKGETQDKMISWLRRSSRADRHDLRTPLNAMLLNILSAQVLGPLNDEQSNSLNAAVRNGRTIAAMVD